VAFVKTCLRDDSELKYSWIDYLPTKPMESFWKPLYQSITSRLQDLPIIQTWEGKHFRHPHEVRFLADSILHNGRPILKDLPQEEQYLSSGYDSQHYKALRDVGVENMTWDEVLLRLRADIVSSQSRLRTIPADDPWHEAFADMLLSAWNPLRPRFIKNIKRLGIIPTVRHQWAGAPGVSSGGPDKIYFAYTGSVPIPEFIGLHLLDRVASLNDRRRKLYSALGVEECPEESVLAKIEEAHTRIPRPIVTGMDNPEFAELRYLFHFHENIDEFKSWVKIPTENGLLKSCSESWYFPSIVPSSAEEHQK
jgi:hypothetical protein